MLVTIQRVLAGITGGVLVGALIGAYFIVRTEDDVVLRADYEASSPITFEMASARYRRAIFTSFVATFAFIGPFVANARFGEWMRPAVYGLVCGMAILCVLTYTVSAFTYQQPFYMTKGAGRGCIDAALRIGIPIAIVVGPICGILVWISRAVVSQRAVQEEMA